MQQLFILTGIFEDLFDVFGAGLVVSLFLAIIFGTIRWYFQAIVGLRQMSLERQRQENLAFLRDAVLTKMIDREIAEHYPQLMQSEAVEVAEHLSKEQIEQQVLGLELAPSA